MQFDISNKKLRKLRTDRETTKHRLRTDPMTGTGALAGLGKNVNTQFQVKICDTFHCDLQDITEHTEEGVGK